MPDGVRCPNPEVLQRFTLGQLPAAELETLAEHVEGCGRCVGVLQALPGGDALVGAMQGLSASAPEPTGELVERLCALHAVTAAPSSGGAEGGRGLLARLTESITENTEELYHFLAPPQAAGELGRLGPYRVLRVLGAGGMGVVFEAEDTHLKRRVALKALRPAMATSASARRRFVREGQAAAALNHDRVVPIYQVGEEHGVPFLAMPLLQGETLEDLLRREAPLQPAEALRIGREICEGLAAAHAQGLIHRDIKPANIWLETPDHSPLTTHHSPNRVKLLDFGLARAVGGDAHLTQSGVVVGTPAYMAPEQARGEPVDQRSDLFSLGSVLYRACTGRLPFPGRNSLDTLLALAQHNPPPPAALMPRLPPGFSDLIMKLLARRPEHRFPTAEAVVEALDAVASGRAPVEAGPRRLSGSSRVILASAFVIVAVAMAGYWLRPGGSPRSGAPEDPAATELFAPAVNYSAGLYPTGVAVADFNRDGKADMVVSNLQSHSVGVLLGSGDGTFGPPVSSPVAGEFGMAVAVDDLDGSGTPDLVVISGVTQISVLLGKGDGTFLSPAAYDVGNHPTSVATADLDGDGKSDVVVGNADSVSVLRSNGDGTFRAAVNQPIGKLLRKVVVGDFDRDGKPDLAVGDSGSNNVAILLGRGDGSFRLGVPCPISVGLDMAAGDLNGDGKLDLVMPGSGTVSVLRGNGDGTFQEATACGARKTGRALLVVDLDRDGWLDLALVNEGDGEVDVALGKGDGTFGEARTHTVGRDPGSAAVGDFNGDGVLDLAVANRNTNNLSVLLQRPPAASQFHLGPPAFFPAGSEPRAVAAGDLDRDGNEDLVVADYAGGAIQVLHGEGEGAFRSGGRYQAGKGPTAVAVGDFDRDGKPDVAVADAPGDAVLVLRGEAGALAAPVAHAAGKNPVAVAVGDFNGDGKLDLTAANYDSGTVGVFLGRGDGTLRDGVTFPSGQRPRSVVVIDLNADGKSDLIVTNRFQVGSVSVLLGKGDGAFAAPVAYPVGAYPISAAAGDFNGDGKVDVAVANWGGSDLNVLPGVGDGTFGSAVNYPAGPGNPFALAAVDINGDGAIDLVVSGGVQQDWVSVLPGKGDGTFSRTLHLYNTGLHPVGLAVGRFRRGGRPDVATVNAHSGNVSVLLNRHAEPYLLAGHSIQSIETDGMTCLLRVGAHKAGDPWRVQDTGYAGTVRVQSSDPRAALPEEYTFKPDDSGYHALRVTLRTPGVQTLTVTDVQGRLLPASVAIRVLRPGDLHYFLEVPESVEADRPFSMTVHIMNPFNTWTDGYGGTIRFQCSDPAAKLPASHTFNRANVHTFTNAFTLPTPGQWQITLTDTATPSLTASVTVKVRPPEATAPR